MNTNNTITNVLVLAETRDAVKSFLKENYENTIKPFITIIDKVMIANNENHFEAMARIQDKSNLSDTPEKKMLFTAALYEIIEEVNLKTLQL